MNNNKDIEELIIELENSIKNTIDEIFKCYCRNQDLLKKEIIDFALGLSKSFLKHEMEKNLNMVYKKTVN